MSFKTAAGLEPQNVQTVRMSLREIMICFWCECTAAWLTLTSKPLEPVKGNKKKKTFSEHRSIKSHYQKALDVIYFFALGFLIWIDDTECRPVTAKEEWYVRKRASQGEFCQIYQLNDGTSLFLHGFGPNMFLWWWKRREETILHRLFCLLSYVLFSPSFWNVNRHLSLEDVALHLLKLFPKTRLSFTRTICRKQLNWKRAS